MVVGAEQTTSQGHHHRFESVTLASVTKCAQCPWPILGLVSTPNRCAECQLVIHRDCLPNVTAECPVWFRANAKMQLEKLKSLFPTLDPFLVEEIFEWSDNMEVIANKLLQEERKKAEALK